MTTRKAYYCYDKNEGWTCTETATRSHVDVGICVGLAIHIPDILGTSFLRTLSKYFDTMLCRRLYFRKYTSRTATLNVRILVFVVQEQPNRIPRSIYIWVLYCIVWWFSWTRNRSFRQLRLLCCDISIHSVFTLPEPLLSTSYCTLCCSAVTTA